MNRQNDTSFQAQSNGNVDHVSDTANYHILNVAASHYDDIYAAELKAVVEEYETAPENKHRLEKFSIEPGAHLPKDLRHCKDEHLNNAIIKEINENIELRNELEKERKDKQEQNRMSSKPSLLSFLSSSPQSVKERFEQHKNNKYITMFQNNTQKVIDAQINLSRSLLVTKSHYSQLETMLNEKNIDPSGADFSAKNLFQEMTSDPGFAEQVRMTLAAHKAVLKDYDFATSEVIDKGTLDVADTAISSGFMDFMNSNEDVYSRQMKNLSKLLEETAPQLDKDYVGNVLDEKSGMFDELNADAIKEFVEKISKLMARFTSNSTQQSQTNQMQM
ncbi:hypothetical protein AB4455_23020 [Vibrio sp. 10N.261.46.E12]|uniref:hypothetical protein n=1 Tax=unclassified Vibrio TaxID=2614977 RepID=UPI000977D81A|nr:MULTISPECIES: hypothetical protein [unclassified Vibrio]OMO38442.1 hypothetical protein BH584_17735 [Vibrio sp. 10N.261.45.E1]PMJ36228.1 hypothetical protein BCU27_23595 [Vibrio sp. 10N.286.45.B6]PML84184.1 hypothetical protein BCT66_17930 [Vibrio sp. 10N.261.49.E11]PMM89300.1 hypothetical protein BCT46_25215 [Vibrio sp. 10N.261.46.E8]PMN44186.1 hypothetical protein BCT32_15730 [Vibrio sp. 10N.261.45.E11]